MYGFAEEDAARDAAGPGDTVHRIEHAFESPLVITDFEANKALNRAMRMVDAIESTVTVEDAVTWDGVIGGEYDPLRVSLGHGLTHRRSGPFDGSSGVERVFLKILLDTPTLSDMYGLDEEAAMRDALRAMRRLSEDGGYHPANEWLYPDFDGVYALPGAGGSDGSRGCVVFSERVEECVGHEVESFEEVDASTLQACWPGNS